MPTVAGREVGEIGFGLMSLTRPDAALTTDAACATLRAALAHGCAFWNGGEFYGPEDNNSLTLLAAYFARHPEDASQVVLSIKGGGNKPFTMRFDSSPASVQRSVCDCAAQLQGRKTMDLFEMARQDAATPVETTMGALGALVQEGTIGGIGLSEVRAETIHRAAKVATIAAVEVELSLMTTDVLTNGVAAACAQHNIPMIAYSPLGHGLLTGTMKKYDELPDKAKWMPRFSRENFATNVQLADQVEALARQKGCTPAQLAINWVRCLGKRPGMPTIIPIPGGTTPQRVAENATIVDLTSAEMDALDEILSRFEVRGARYPEGIPIDT